MKITALISDELIHEVKELSQGKNITDSLTIALKGWVAIQKIKILNTQLKEKPLEFTENFVAETVREYNRDK